MKTQHTEAKQDHAAARRACQEVLKHCWSSLPFWHDMCEFQSRSNLIRARAVLENARSQIDKVEGLPVCPAACELKQTDRDVQKLLSKSLLACPNTGQLCAFTIV